MPLLPVRWCTRSRRIFSHLIPVPFQVSLDPVGIGSQVAFVIFEHLVRAERRARAYTAIGAAFPTAAHAAFRKAAFLVCVVTTDTAGDCINTGPADLRPLPGQCCCFLPSAILCS